MIVACCLFDVCSLFIARCSLFVVASWCFVLGYLFLGAGSGLVCLGFWALFDVCCVSFVVCCLLRVVRCLCSLFDV